MAKKKVAAEKAKVKADKAKVIAHPWTRDGEAIFNARDALKFLMEVDRGSTMDQDPDCVNGEKLILQCIVSALDYEIAYGDTPAEQP